MTDFSLISVILQIYTDSLLRQVSTDFWSSAFILSHNMPKTIKIWFHIHWEEFKILASTYSWETIKQKKSSQFLEL